MECEYLRQIEETRRDLYNLISSNKKIAPLVLRLAFHDAAGYDKNTRTGGANGSIRFELNKPPNKGMDTAVSFLEQVKRRHPKVTYADLYQLAGIVAVRVTGGPIIEFIPGRVDAQHQTDQGSIPNPRGDAAHLRSIFVGQLGLTDKDIVVLSGAHALGRAHKDRSGFDGPFTRDPLTFDNSYYIELLKGDTPGLVKFPTDKVLLSDRVFRPLVQLYARNEEAFFNDYAISHKKLSLLGSHNINSTAQYHNNVPNYHAQDQFNYQGQQNYAEPEDCYAQSNNEDAYDCEGRRPCYPQAQDCRPSYCY